MNAIKKPKKEVNNRTRLETVIPLNTPFSILIESSDKCNFKCKFCPTGNYELMKNTAGRNYGNIDFNLYKKIINDIDSFENKLKILYLHNRGEPLLNPNIADMVKIAKNSNKIEKVVITTNAYLLNEKLSLNIINAGLDILNISIEGTDKKGYYDIAGVDIDFDSLVKKILYFYQNRKQCKMHIKIVNNNMSENEKDKFYNIFGDICDYIFIENIVNTWYEFDIEKLNITKNNTLIGGKIKNRNICPRIFYTCSINSNGSVSACCVDWKNKLIIGDAYKESIKDIWNGNKLKEFQLYMLNGHRKEHHFCSSCDLPIYGADDDLDEYASIIINNMNRTEQNRTEQNRTEQNRTEQF